MEQNNGTVPQEQPAVTTNEMSSPAANNPSDQLVTSYGVVSRDYVEYLIENNSSVKKPKKSVGKRILGWFFGIVGGVTFLVLCVLLCFNAFKFSGQNQTALSNDSESSFDDDFFYVPDFFGEFDDFGGFGDFEDYFTSDSDIVMNDSSKTSNAGLGVVVTEIDSSSSQTYGLAGGLVIVGIEPDSSFAGTDVKEYDIITGAEGVEITSTASLSNLLNKHQVGDEFTLTITRFVDGFAESFDVTVTLIDKTA